MLPFHKTQIEINTDIRENRKTASFLQLVVKFVVAWVFFLSFGSLIYYNLKLDEIRVSVPIALIVGFEIAVMTLISQERIRREGKYRLLYPLILSICIVAVCMLFYRQFTNGLCCYMNQVSELMMEAKGIIYLGFETSGNTYIGVQIFSAVVAAVLAYLCVYITGEGKIPVVVVLPILTAVGVCMGIIPVNIWLIVFAAATGLIIVYRFMISTVNRTKYRPVLPVLAAVTCLALLLGVLVSFTGAHKVADVSTIKDATVQLLHEKKYEKSPNPMPEGRLRNLKAFEPENNIALQVAMGSPEATYLRGFVGEVYKDNKWNGLKGKSISENGSLFYWLHRNNFYGQSQLGDLYSVKEKADTEDFMSIFLVSGCKAYFYTPYGLNQNSLRLSDERLIGDKNIVCKDGKASSDYVLNYTPGAVKKSYVLQQELETVQTSGDVSIKQHLDNEDSYRGVMYENYLQLPKSTEKLFKSILGAKKKLNTTEAKLKVLDYLGNKVIYKENINTKTNDEDFLKVFLTKNHAGYAPHYATAAVMMLRYYGVPARYVEGYIVTGEQSKAADSGEPISVFEESSHAWAEYYLDGVGWLPFETIPKYMDEDMFEQTGDVAVSGEGGSSAIKEGQSDKNTGEDDNSKLEEKKTDNPLNTRSPIFVFKVLILLGILVLLAAIGALVTHWRRKRMRAFLASFEGEDRSLAVENAFAYGVMLIRRKKMTVDSSFPRRAGKDVAKLMGENGENNYLNSIEINEKVKFSLDKVTEEERQSVLDFKDEVFKIYMQSRGRLGRLYDKLFLCIY